MSNPHKVTASPAGYFEVQSGRSGETYRVMPSVTGLWALCPCAGFTRRGRCSHVHAVLDHARQFPSAVKPEPRSADELFRRIDSRRG